MPKTESAEIVIIGGGVIGLSIAYHLAQLGQTDVILIERNQLTSGTSWHAAGIVGPLRATMNLTKLARYAIELFPWLETETGQSTGYRRTGGFWLAQCEARMEELRRIAAIGAMSDLEAKIVVPDEIAAKAPFLKIDDLAGGLWVQADAQANPVDICMAYAKGARSAGIELRENAVCREILIENGVARGVKLATGDIISCKKIANCAGAWAHGIGRMAGIPIPLQAVEHMYIVTEPIDDLPNPVPVVRDLDGRIYIKGDAGKLVIGGFEPNAQSWDAHGLDGDRAFLELPENWEQFEPFMEAGLNRIPLLEETGIQRFMNGPESFTPDSKPLMGQSPYLQNFFVAAGFNSIGMMSSAGCGKAMAEWICAGEAPMDLWDVDIARFGKAEAAEPFLKARMKEAVSDVLDMHWPLKQPTAGRDLRRTAFHDRFAAAGAFFGAPAWWERPLWFALNETEKEFHYSYGGQCWWKAAQRECKVLENAVGLMELSPFSKIDVKGPDALALLQLLCVNDVDVEPGRAVYTQMLNARAGIEADLTVTRIDGSCFRIVGGAATRHKDLAWIRHHRNQRGFQAETADVTNQEAVLGVMGPCSRELLQKVSSSDFSPAAFPFGRSKSIDLSGVGIRATRMSFAGELGWELYIPVASAMKVFDAVARAGTGLNLQPVGHLALDCCRLEKGFLHWGHDIGPDETPLEAGLSYTVAWNKENEFLGRDALEAQRQRGVSKQLLQFQLDDLDVLLLHEEPIYRDGEIIGRTTSGGRGFRTGTNLCFGYVECRPGSTKAELARMTYEVGVAGKVYPLTALAQPVYDPSGERMRR